MADWQIAQASESAPWRERTTTFARNTAFAARQLGRACLDTVLPPTDDTELFTQLTFIDDPCCSACGFPFAHALVGLDEADTQCGSCTARPPAFDTVRSAMRYDEHSRPVVLAFKHGGHTDRLKSFAAQMHRAGRVALRDADVLLPVPLHRSRLVSRRYNQSALLARALSKRTGVPMDASALLRARRTPSQGGLSAVGRRRNVAGAFVVPDRARVEGLRVVIIDDVMTTGATLSSCARVLRKAGAARIDAVCLARVVKPLPTP